MQICTSRARGDALAVTELAKARASEDITQEELAQRAGVSRDTVKRAERGARPNLRNQFKMAKALGAKREDLFPEEAA